MEKLMLSGERFLFRPIEIISGVLDKDDVFVTDHGTEYYRINDSAIAFSEVKECYGFNITLDELNDLYTNEDGETTIENYFKDIIKSVYIGVYKYEIDAIEIKSIPFDKLDKYREDVVVANSDNDLIVELTKQDIDTFLSMNNIEQVHNKFYLYKNCLEAISKLNTNKNANLSEDELPNVEEHQLAIVKPFEQKKQVLDNVMDVNDLYEKVVSAVKSQDEQVEDIISTIAMNYMSKNRRNRSHILITGPTGSGKSEIMERISEYINVPMAKFDMTQISVTGYVGKNIDDILVRLFNNANQNLERAEHGILALDEIDKKASDSNGDVSGRGVLNSLLKLLDGTVYDLEYEKGKRVPFDTSNLTVVAMGAFSNMKNHRKNPLGFTHNLNPKEIVTTDVEDYVKFGIPEEFMGRFTTIVSLNELSLEDLKTILCTSAISPLVIKQEVLRDFGIRLHYTEGYIEAVAKRAIALKTGARSLKSTVDYSLKKAEFEILKNKQYKDLTIDDSTVTNNRVYVLK